MRQSTRVGQGFELREFVLPFGAEVHKTLEQCSDCMLFGFGIP